MKNRDIKNKINKLPDYLIPELNDFLDFLITKYGYDNKAKDSFKFDWEGGLSKLKSKYTSVELQHKSLEWRQ